MAPLDETLADPAASPSGLAPGAQLGRFTLRRVLGRGGMGVVWAAHDPDLDREIAIKVLRHDARATDALRKRLLREARAMARLKHPNVITVYEVGTTGDTDFIAMELVEGRTLDDWLGHGPPADDVWRAILGAGRGLAAAHAAGLVHRDFKPHNVLRSRDGRVLVTDFGLARGLGDEVAEAAPVAAADAAAVGLDVTLDASPRLDSVLDSPLTQTGAMIGTPAYMAPEQFHGAPPDPRTDQFAFCVSAWQALTGTRPFLGDTLDELRRAAAAGVDGVVADLPKPTRAALARGLDPDPAKRWPDLDALLDALERARRPRVRRWPFALAAAVVGAAVVFAIGRGGEPAPVAAPCEPADRAFAEAWSDTARAELGGGAAGEATRDRVARGFEQLRGKWIASYQDACNAPPSRHTAARLACLRGVRDQTAALRLAMNRADQRALDDVDVHGMLPNVAACNGATPVAPPEVPADQPRRGKILDVIARAIALRAVPREQLAGAIDSLVADAAATGWQPLGPIVEVAAGNLYLRHGELAKARALLRRALVTADPRSRALAHVGLLEAAVHELEVPGAEAPTGELHPEIVRQRTYARSAVRAAGNDPLLVGAVASLEAAALAAQASRMRKASDDALLLAAEARAAYTEAGDLRRAARIAAFEAAVHLDRGHDRALDDAEFVARSADEALRAAGIASPPALDEVRARIAFARGDRRAAHAYFDRRADREPPREGVRRTGRVVDRAGRPQRATVVVWSGELHGDPSRAYTDSRFDGEVIETADDGTFAFTSSPGTAIVAETADARSTPRSADGDVTLVVGATRALTGTVRGAVRPVLVAAFARYRLGDASWYLRAPVGRDGAFRIDHAPAGGELGLAGPAGDGTRRVVDRPDRLAWPAGPAIEVILRSDEGITDAQAWVFRSAVAARTRADLEALARRAPDVATARLHAIGAAATAAGREIYAAGDVHAIIDGNAAGDVTVCVTLVDEAIARAYCTPLVLATDDALRPVLFSTAASPTTP